MPAPRIESVQKLRERARLNILFTAPSGWGKTPTIGTADQRATGGPKAVSLCVDPEGAVSAAYSGSTMDIVDCPDWPTLEAAVKLVKPKVLDGTYSFLIVDSITEVQRGMMRHDLNLQYGRSPAKRDINVPAQDNYLRTQMQLVEFVKSLNSWPCTTIWTAHQQEWEDSEGESRYIPMIHGGKGAVANEVMGYMMVHGSGQFIPQDGDKPDIRRMWFSNSGPYRARDRTNKLPLFLDSPTIPQITELISSAPAKKAVARRPVRRVGK